MNVDKEDLGAHIRIIDHRLLQALTHFFHGRP